MTKPKQTTFKFPKPVIKTPVAAAPSNKITKASLSILDFIMGWEGTRLHSYLDTSGIWTIGMGHTGTDVGPGMSCTLAQAKKWFQKDIARFEACLVRGVKVSVSQNEFDAMLSLAYNIGETAFTNSTLLRELNKRNYGFAGDQLDVWINDANGRSEGLVRRRNAEQLVWFQNDYSARP